ncbi:MAG: mandelate racemase/muconate lactonizing enzyme family protein [Planctomycetales bacterium]|nr:mandelate racemase/muconate lactonizing enzyme family protein [Planctomycetales bacterium]
MRIEHVELFYLSMPEVKDIGDGSQDALVIKVCADGLVGWGECEASPLVSIANWICPMSHSVCKPVRDSVIGAKIETPNDIVELGEIVRANGLDIAQTDHTWSGIEIALWDLLGKKLQTPVYRMVGYERAYPKTPYASQLFGDTPAETLEKAKQTLAKGYHAVKFGWGVYGRGTADEDRDHVAAAREGIGKDGILMIDAGTIWRDNVEAAELRADALERHHVYWFEEPFVGEALHAYKTLSTRRPNLPLAGGEGASNFHSARHLIDYGGIRFIQIDTGRIGGIAPAKAVADYAVEKNVTFVNHTFTTHLALSASLTPFAGIESHNICEYPVEASSLAVELTNTRIEPNNGQVGVPDSPGLGVEVNEQTIEKYRVDVQIVVDGRRLF